MPEFIQYERIAILSDAQIQDIMSKPTEDSIKLSSVIVPTLDARVVGKDITDEDKEEILSLASSSKIQELRDCFCYFEIAREYGDYLMSLLPNCPVTKAHVLMEELLVLADQQDKELLAIKNTIEGNGIRLSYEHSKNRRGFLNHYKKIMTSKGLFVDSAFDVKLIPEVKNAEGNNDMVNAFTSYYSLRRDALANIGNGFTTLYDECLKSCSPIIACVNPALLDSYIEASDLLRDQTKEYQEVQASSRVYKGY
jgi:hypothetical protein